ncbi:hypothetical protein FSP39_010265 [Pinctada imbricata]|uniref:SH3 domain-containing protein n=1 Tax=Pinctada imbricata TaxID=66713 RepID=A0AA88YBL5_PINIB|nr:hypothetical protein FSP39_010265 [Pinctada imbricata]
MHAEDGLRKLRNMEQSTGIWTMRCSMAVERKYLVIIDKANGEELERFPIENVHDPTAIFKDDRREIYTNLILFTVLEDPRRRGGQADMHIFQSISAPAQHIVDDIQAVKEGRARPPGPRIPPPPMGPAPDPPRFGDDMRNTRGGGLYGGGGGLAPNRASFIPQGSDMDMGQNEALERDVQLLNSCFDDIEKFVSRLQQAAEAYKELERRKRERSAKKNKPPKDGMLNMRARPPPADDFIDIFQKFKFAFNLLAKLKAHIHDPNAPELVHFLFTPLSLIYEASRDPVHGGRDLADMAVRPPITPEARQLLLNCLTSKELELWTSLGKSWTGNREDMREFNEPYVPKFYNGWSPSPSIPIDSRIDNRMMMEEAVANQRRQVEGRYMEERARNEAQDMLPQYNNPEREYRFGQSKRFDEYDNYNDDITSPYARSTKRPNTPPSGAVTNPNVARYQEHVERHIDRNREVHKPMGRQDDIYKSAPQPMSKDEENVIFAQEVLRSNGKQVYFKVMECVHDRTGRNPKEITVQKGDVLQVLDDSRNWWKVKNVQGQIGYAPYTILKEYQASDMDADKTRGRRSSGEYSSQIPANGGPTNHHIPPAPPVPGSHRRQDMMDYDQYDRDSDRRRSKDYDRRDSNKNRGRDNQRDVPQRRTASPPPPPPVPQEKKPPPPPSRPALKRPKDRTPTDDLTDELSRRFSNANIVDTKKVGLTTKVTSTSSSEDVKDWLINKAFSKRCQQVLNGYNGEDLFRMKKKEMDRLLGAEEAHRLESMVLVQKNKAGYKTQSAAELNRILQKRKQRAESSNTDRAIGKPPSFVPDSPDYSDSDSDSMFTLIFFFLHFLHISYPRHSVVTYGY